MKIYYMSYPGSGDSCLEGRYFPDLKSLKAAVAADAERERDLAPALHVRKLSERVETRASYKGVLVVPVHEVKVTPVNRQTLCDLAAGSRVIPGAVTEVNPVRIKFTISKKGLPDDFELPTIKS